MWRKYQKENSALKKCEKSWKMLIRCFIKILLRRDLVMDAVAIFYAIRNAFKIWHKSHFPSMTHTIWLSMTYEPCIMANVKIFMLESLHPTKNKCSEFHVITIRFLTLKKEKSFVPMFVFVVPCLFSVGFISLYSLYVLKCIVTFHFL